MRARKLLGGVVAGAILVTSAMVGTGTAQALTSTTHPQLSLNRLIQTSLFPPPNRMFDNEGSAYVAGDDALWMADDQSDALFEVDRTTGALRRKIPQAAFLNALPLGGGGTAGQSRNEDLEALAYDANADVLYAFSGSTPFLVNSVSTPSDPTVYRLTRDVDDQFQVESWQALPSEWTGAGWRLADGLTYVANDTTIRTYDYATNTFGAPFSIPGLSKILGMDFDDATGDLLAVNNKERLYRASMTTGTLRDGWNEGLCELGRPVAVHRAGCGISLTGLGLLDTRAVEVIGDQVLVSDGYDFRAASDPMNHAVFVLDTTDTTDPTVTIVTPSAGAVYARNQVVNADFRCADTGGSGLASCVGTVADGQAINTATLGQKTFTVTARDAAGNIRVRNRTYTVASARPDGRIRRGTGAPVGNDVYSTTGAGQTRTGTAARRQSVSYYVSAQNDAAFPERLRLLGQPSTNNFAVRYYSPAGAVITRQVTAGTFRTPVLVPRGAYRVKVVVTVLNGPRNAPVARTLTAFSTKQPLIRDTVRFVTSRA